MGQPGYILYGGGPTRSMLVEMVLAEGAIPYELREIDIFQGEHRGPEFLAVNPLGWIPALVTPDRETICETPAINLWLCEAHELQLVPPPGDALRGQFLTAFHNVIGEVEPTLKRVFFPQRYALAPEQTTETRKLAVEMLDERLRPLDCNLAQGGPFFLGDRLSLADLTLAYWTAYAERWGGLDEYPALRRALNLCRSRPSLRDIFKRQSDWTEKLQRERSLASLD
jgi:glutathione S-transferase